MAEAASRVLELMASPLEPIAVEWVSGDPGRLLVRLEGGAQTLPARVERLRELLGADAREVGADAWDAHTSLTDGPHAGGDGDGPALDGAVVDGPAQRPLDPRQVTVADGSITLA